MTLYATLEALTEPSREVDSQIATALSGPGKPALPTLAYTSDLNAVIELIEREIGPAWEMQRDGNGCWATIGHQDYNEERHTLPAIALLLALFKARGEG